MLPDQMPDPRPDVEMRIWICSHDGSDYHYAIPATDAIMAALAYARVVAGTITADQERRIWVRSDRPGHRTGISYPLATWNAQTVVNYLEADPIRSHLLNASIDGATQTPIEFSPVLGK